MKRQLNPNLARQRSGEDKTFPFEEHWVILREPKANGDTREPGIGPTSIEEVQESATQRNALAAQIRDTELALADHAGVEPEVSPHLILCRDCFGFIGPVRLLIYSNKPFA